MSEIALILSVSLNGIFVLGLFFHVKALSQEVAAARESLLVKKLAELKPDAKKEQPDQIVVQDVTVDDTEGYYEPSFDPEFGGDR